MITQSKLKELLHYDPLTGYFTWLIDKPKSHIYKAGRMAGGLDVHGYIQINVAGQVSKAHRLAWLYMTGEWPRGQTDHINHDRADNRWMNLRVVDNTINHRNRPMQRNNSSGFVGVSQDKNDGKWVAFIHFNKKRIHLGRFADLSDAIECRRVANEQYGYHVNHGKTQGRISYYDRKKLSVNQN